MALGKRRTRIVARVLFVSTFLCVSGFLHYSVREDSGHSNLKNLHQRSKIEQSSFFLRRLKSATTAATEGETTAFNSSFGFGNVSETTSEPSEEHCIKPAIHEFPGDIFTHEQRGNGAVLLHVFCAIYMFVALAIVCDEYFVSSLEKICERLRMSEDVAGATFMAAGSSAPELFTSIIGVFVTKGDMGVGTIVGSAVFNILIIIGICSLFAGQIVPLTWWPLVRDSSIYCLSIVVLILVIRDGRVAWYEALLMLLLYGSYIVFMSFNSQIISTIDVREEKRRKKREEKRRKKLQAREDANNEVMIPLDPASADAINSDQTADKKEVLMVDEYLYNNSPKRLSFSDSGLKLMMTSHFSPRTRLRAACWMIITEKAQCEQDPDHRAYLRVNKENGRQSTRLDSPNAEHNGGSEGVNPSAVVEFEDGLFSFQKTACGIFRWAFVFPITGLLYFTIPDCRKERFERWFLVTFAMSIFWIATFTYVMVWMMAIVGFTLHIPETLMGIVFLAAGTSVPDAMASLIVARQGLGDMAVSNSIGSNIFDILLGLALPWFLKTTAVNYGSFVPINSKGLFYSVILLFATVAIIISSIHFNGWKLDRRLGIICLVFYAIFIMFSTLIEFNVFGHVNPPICPI